MLNFPLRPFSEYINIKLEGLNGQLPNLDLVNLVQKLAIKERLPCGYKMTNTKRHTAAQSWRRNAEKMWSMVLTQANGVPTGNHGLYHRYGIEAVTLEGVSKKSAGNSAASIMSLLKLVEGISRSLNNLLEKFHQSFFFYVIVAHDRFVSIGDYMPCIGLMGGSLLIKAFLHWLESNDESESDSLSPAKDSFDLLRVGLIFIVAHALGFLTIYLPSMKVLNDAVFAYGITTEVQLFVEFVAISVIGLLLGSLMRVKSQVDVHILHIVGLLELGTILLVVGMLNFSLGFLLCLVTVPVAINLRAWGDGRLTAIKKAVLVLIHPVVLSGGIVLLLTIVQFAGLTPLDLAKQTLSATMNAFTFSVIDSIVSQSKREFGVGKSNTISCIPFRSTAIGSSI